MCKKEEFEFLATCIEQGLAPEDPRLLDFCSKAAHVAALFEALSAETKDPVAVQLVSENEHCGIPLGPVHEIWKAAVDAHVVSKLPVLRSKFSGKAIFQLGEDVSVYATYARLLEFTCPACKVEYRSEINKRRCEASHASAKRPQERSMLSISNLVAYWDGLNTTGRLAIAKRATRYLAGIPSGSSFSPNVAALVKLAAGGVTLAGERLMVALDEASEYTFCYRLLESIDGSKLYTRADYVAAIAHVVISHLAKEHSEQVARALLEDIPDISDAPKGDRKKKKKKKKKKRATECAQCQSPPETPKTPVQPGHDDDTLERHVVADIEFQQRAERQMYLNRLEHLMWHTDLLNVVSWDVQDV